jgi:hypothetical protein
MAVKEVRTNIDPEFIHQSLLEVYQKWVNFAMGVGKLGNRMLKSPSGKMASAIKADFDEDGHVVALFVDEESIGKEANDLLLSGHKGFSLKSRMLQAGKRGVRTSVDKKTGKKFLYRYVPIADRPTSPKAAFGEASRITNLFTTTKGLHGGTLQINKNLARIWVSNFKKAHTGSIKIRTMSNKPGSARWWIPAMKPFNAGFLLKQMLKQKQLKDRVIV